MNSVKLFIAIIVLGLITACGELKEPALEKGNLDQYIAKDNLIYTIDTTGGSKKANPIKYKD